MGGPAGLAGRKITPQPARCVGLAAGSACMTLVPFTATVNPMVASVPVIAAVVLIAVLCRPRRVSEEARAAARDAFIRAEETWQALVRDWQAQPTPNFSGKRQVIEGLKASLDALMLERETRIKALEKTIPEAEQRARYLGQFRIEDAGLYNMGPHESPCCARGGSRPPQKSMKPKSLKFRGLAETSPTASSTGARGLSAGFDSSPLLSPIHLRCGRSIVSLQYGASPHAGAENPDCRPRKAAHSIRDARAVLWKRLETAFNACMLARHNAELPAVDKTLRERSASQPALSLLKM